jgi:predicted dehydrogenase
VRPKGAKGNPLPFGVSSWSLRRLMIAHRLHYERYNLAAMKAGRERQSGPIKMINAEFSFVIGDPRQWRLKHQMAGGGSLMDIDAFSEAIHQDRDVITPGEEGLRALKIMMVCYESPQEDRRVKLTEGQGEPVGRTVPAAPFAGRGVGPYWSAVA